MSTIKSSSANLTLNADGSGNDIKFQSNGVEKASIDQDGLLTCVGATMSGALAINTNSNVILTGDGVGFVATDDGGCSISMYAGDSLTELTTSTNHDMVFKTNATEHMRIASAGDVTVSTGDIVFGTAGKGICLGATTNVDANTLDDYEEGTWTPVISGSTSTTGQGYDAQTGSYTKIGNKVFCSFNMDLSAKGTIVGFLKITGFPFTMSPAHQNACTFGNTRQWYLTADHHLQGTVYGTNIVYLYECSQQADVPSQLDTNALVDSTIVLGSFFFTTTD